LCGRMGWKLHGTPYACQHQAWYGGVVARARDSRRKYVRTRSAWSRLVRGVRTRRLPQRLHPRQASWQGHLQERVPGPRVQEAGVAAGPHAQPHDRQRREPVPCHRAADEGEDGATRAARARGESAASSARRVTGAPQRVAKARVHTMRPAQTVPCVSPKLLPEASTVTLPYSLP
jgi:hypothetical protein